MTCQERRTSRLPNERLRRVAGCRCRFGLIHERSMIARPRRPITDNARSAYCTVVLAGATWRTGFQARLQIATWQRVIEIRRDDLRSGHEALEVDGGIDPHLLEHVDEVLGGHVAAGTRRVRTPAEAARGGIEVAIPISNAPACSPARSHVCRGSAWPASTAESPAAGCRPHSEPDGVPDADGVADRHFVTSEVEKRALTSSTFSGATSPS